MCDQPREHLVQGDRLPSDVHDAPREPHEQADHDQHAQQSEFFAEHGQQEVGVCFGQPVQFLHAATQADAEDLAPAERDQGVRQLIALAQRVLDAPRVQIGKDALTPPVTHHHHERERTHHHQRNQEEHAGVHATEEQDAHGDDHDHHEGAHVGFGQQQHAHHRHGYRHGRHSTEKALFHFHAPHHVVGGIQQHRQLGQLGGLKVHDAHRDPAARAIDPFANEGKQHQHQQQQRKRKQPWRRTFPGLHGELEGHDGGHHADHHEQTVPGHKVGVGVVGEAGVVRQRNRCRVHHDQAPGQQTHHHPQQWLIKTQFADRQVARARVGAVGQAHRNAIGRSAARQRPCEVAPQQTTQQGRLFDWLGGRALA